MKFLLFFILSFYMFNLNLYANEDKTQLILQEIRTINKDIKDLREDMNKRFEQVDKRFDQFDKRLDFMQNILYALMGIIFASPFIAIYLRDKREAEDRKYFDNMKAILFVLREIAQDDEKIAKALRSANLL